MKVLISDTLSPRAIEVFKEAGIAADVKTGLKEDALIAIIGDYDGLAIRSATKVNAKVLAAATKLKVVGRAGIGVDNVDLPAATERGVLVMNTPFGNSVATAEHTLSLLMSITRQIPSASAATKAGTWPKSKYMGVELTGKVLGIIGCGNIGSVVADRAQGLKMHVVACDPHLTSEHAKALNVERVDLDQLLRMSDFITLHTTINETTKHILNKETLAKTKKGVRIVNCARGGLIQEADLFDALQSGHVAAAALDVFETEPATDSPLFGLDQVVVTPHLGASTHEAQENVAAQIAEQISSFLNTGLVVNPVNSPKK